MSSLADQGFKSYWEQDSSLWIENLVNSKTEFEKSYNQSNLYKRLIV